MADNTNTVPSADKKPISWFRILLYGIAGIAVALAILLASSSLEEVTVEGNKMYDQSEIMSVVLNDEFSWNTLYVYLKYRFKEPEAIPFIDTLEIELTSFHSLTVHVYEKGMMGYLYIKGANTNAYFDKDGIVVETSPNKIANIPCVKGIDCDQVVLHEELAINGRTLREILTVTQTLKRDDLIPEEIVYGKTHSPILVYGDVEVYLGEVGNLTPKLERFTAIYPSVKNEKGVLHLENWTTESANIIFSKE